MASAAVATAVVATLVAASETQNVHPFQLTTNAPALADARHRAPTTVTLITGDKVTVTPGPAGAAPSVNVERAPGATGSVRVTTEGRDTYVFPDEAMPYIADGRLDKELFDVTELISQGYDDAHANSLPLIVTHKKSAATLKPAVLNGSSTPRPNAALPGSETTLSLPVVHGEAVRTRRSKSATFWSALTGGSRRPGTTTRRGPRRPSLSPRRGQGVARWQVEGRPCRQHGPDRRSRCVGKWGNGRRSPRRHP
ncbi:hypothetical protein ACFQ51_54445 [Streptomyces kaempferi]